MKSHKHGGPEPLLILGMMTGTSCDGIDGSCLSISADGWSPVWSESAPYPSDLRRRVLKLQDPGTRTSLKDLLALDRDLGDWYARAARSMASKHPDQIPELIANHGQTVAHFPAPGAKGTTCQLGDPSRIVAATGLTVVSHFRHGDLAAGGQGAPLVPMFHLLIAQALGLEKGGVAIHNLGGISNLSYIGPEGNVLAFDTGPANAWIDAAASLATRGKLRMDKGGKLAARGTVDKKALALLMKHPYFKLKPPKSTGRDDFPIKMMTDACRSRGEDLVATATALTCESIAQAYRQHIIKLGHPLRQILICGGGAKNPTLLAGLRKLLPEVTISSLSDAGFDAQWVESQAFALFGYLSLNGRPVGGPWTGAKGFGPPGWIIPGRNWEQVLMKLSE